jgi:hypothetical protein
VRGARRRDARRVKAAWVVAGATLIATTVAGVVVAISVYGTPSMPPTAAGAPKPPAVALKPSAVAQAAVASPGIGLWTPTPVLYVRRGGTATGTIRVSNTGDTQLTVSGAELVGGSYFTLATASRFTLAGGASKDLKFSFTPKTSGPKRTSLTVHSQLSDVTLKLGGLAIDNTAGSEPSLQWILDAYGISANDGDQTPSSYPLNATKIPPAGGILVKGFTRLSASNPVRVTALAAFVNPATSADRTKDPAWGWMAQGKSPGSATASYRIRRGFIGTRYAITPGGTFGLWVKAEGTTLRTDLNTATRPRFVAFPVSGSPGAYVVAVDTTGRTIDDWNDLPLLVQNVSVVR